MLYTIINNNWMDLLWVKVIQLLELDRNYFIWVSYF